MNVRLLTAAGETHEVESARPVRLEFHVAGEDIPRAYWLHELRSLEVLSGQPQPAAVAEPSRLVERELDVSTWAYTHEQPGEKVRVGPRRSVRVHVPEPVPVEKPKPRAKAKP